MSDVADFLQENWFQFIEFLKGMHNYSEDEAEEEAEKLLEEVTPH